MKETLLDPAEPSEATDRFRCGFERIDVTLAGRLWTLSCRLGPGVKRSESGLEKVTARMTVWAGEVGVPEVCSRVKADS